VTAAGPARTARGLILAAAILTLAEVPFSGWIPGIVLMLGLWAACLLALARVPLARSSVLPWVLAGVALASCWSAIGWLRIPDDERVIVPAYGAQVTFSVVHALLLSAATVLVAAPRARVRWAHYRALSQDGSLTGPRTVGAGLAVWTAALLILMPWFLLWPGPLKAWPAATAAGAVYFATRASLVARHRVLASLALWSTVAGFAGIVLLPVPYALLGLYLAMSPRGVLVLLGGLIAITLVAIGRGHLRAALAPARSAATSVARP
jgi:hypothetical protein